MRSLEERDGLRLAGFPGSNPGLSDVGINAKEEYKMTKPIQTFRVGAIQAAVWENEGKEGRMFKSVTLQKRYKAENDEWKTSSSLMPNDLPKAALALNKAFEFISLKEGFEDNTEFSSAEKLAED